MNQYLYTKILLNQYWFAFSFFPMMRVTFGVARAVRRELAVGGCYNRLHTGGGIVAGWWNGWYWRARMSPYNPNVTLYIRYKI